MPPHLNESGPQQHIPAMKTILAMMMLAACMAAVAVGIKQSGEQLNSCPNRSGSVKFGNMLLLAGDGQAHRPN
jgi:hypothetical protein